MSNIYSVGLDGKSLIPSSSAYPIIKLGSGLDRVDFNQLASALNYVINVSSRAASEFQWAASEGIVFYGSTYENTAHLGYTCTDPLSLDGFSE